MLIPNAKYTVNGVTVNEKIIPDGTKWTNAANAKAAGFCAGDLYKKQQKLCSGTGRPKYVTIHNTGDLVGVTDDAEQYTRATYNENMGSARVHYYVDENGAWQNLKAGTGMCSNDPVGSAEVSWHAGDGSTKDGGNMTSLSIEVIMGDVKTENNTMARDNGARLAAWLLNKHGLGIDKLVTHTYWVNKSVGKSFSDVDEQCCNPIYGKKWCPAYIFASTIKENALKNWKAFKKLVEKYMKEDSNMAYAVKAGVFFDREEAEAAAKEIAKLGYEATVIYDENSTAESPADRTIKVGDAVKCKEGAKYADGSTMPSWVQNATLYVRQIEKDGKVYLVSTEKTEPVYTGRVNSADVEKC